MAEKDEDHEASSAQRNYITIASHLRAAILKQTATLAGAPSSKLAELVAASTELLEFEINACHFDELKATPPERD